MMIKRQVHFFSGMLMIMVFILAILKLVDSWNTCVSDNLLYWMSLITAAICFLFVLTKKNYKIGFQFIVLVYTVLCQFGYVWAAHWNLDIAMIRSENTMRFLELAEYSNAVLLSIIFIEAYCFAVVTLGGRQSNNKAIEQIKCKDSEKYDSDNNERSLERFSRVSFRLGMIILFLGLILLVFSYWSTRTLGYNDMKRYLISLHWYGHIVIINSLSFPMIMINCDPKKWKYAVVPYAGIIILNLIMGNRGEVLYTIITCVAIANLKQKRVNWKWLLVGTIGIMLVIPIIRVYRVTLNLDSYEFSFSESIIETFSEIGFQIAPFTYTIQLINKGVGYRLGGTYFYGIIDFIIRKIPFWSDINISAVNNIKFIMPKKGMGYSQIAEFYYNFGIVGAIILMFLLGKMLLKFDELFTHKNSSPYKRMFAGLFVVEIVNLTRNSSGSLMVYLTYILIFVMIIRGLCNRS